VVRREEGSWVWPISIWCHLEAKARHGPSNFLVGMGVAAEIEHLHSRTRKPTGGTHGWLSGERPHQYDSTFVTLSDSDIEGMRLLPIFGPAEQFFWHSFCAIAGTINSPQILSPLVSTSMCLQNLGEHPQVPYPESMAASPDPMRAAHRIEAYGSVQALVVNNDILIAGLQGGNIVVCLLVATLHSISEPATGLVTGHV
jgi:hypothetical protein